MRFNSRLLTGFVAGVTSVAVATSGLPVAGAASFEVLTKPYAAPTAAPQDVVLQVGTDEASVNLNWITAAGVSGQSVQFAPKGTALAEGQTVAAASTDSALNITEGYKDEAPEAYAEAATHKATLSGLAENTEYAYRVGSDKDGWSQEYTFNTGTYGEEWNFVFVGDPQLYVTHDLDKETASWDAAVTKAVAQGPSASFILSAGDQSNYSNMQENSGFISPDAMRSTRVAVNKGNHEMSDENTYNATYNRPNDTDGNYWYEYNNALVVSLDSNSWEDLNEDIDWLRTTVKEQGADKDWVILTYHHSSFSQAYHMEDRQIEWWRDNLTPVISELDIDLVLGGHDHIYTRSHLMRGYEPVNNQHEAKSGETIAKEPGEVQYVAMNSSSGSKFYQFYDYKAQKRDEDVAGDFTTSNEEKTIRDYTAIWDQDESPDFANVSITPDALTYKVTDAWTGETEDEFTLTKAAATDNDDQNGNNNSSDASSISSKGADANGSSTGGIVALVLAILAAIGGGAFAAFNGMIPGLKLPNIKF